MAVRMDRHGLPGTTVKGAVQTVFGPIEPSELGITLTHEHLLIDLRCYWSEPEEAGARAYVDNPVKIDLVGRIRWLWHVVRANLALGRQLHRRHHQRRARPRPHGAGSYFTCHRVAHRHGRRLLRACGRLSTVSRPGPANYPCDTVSPMNSSMPRRVRVSGVGTPVATSQPMPR